MEYSLNCQFNYLQLQCELVNEAAQRNCQLVHLVIFNFKSLFASHLVAQSSQ